jgi:hypothetical protein
MSHNKKPAIPFRKVSPISVKLVWTYRTCLGEYVHVNGEAVTAVFTVVLAISTILLWSSTDRLWKAGERQIESAIKSANAAKEAAEALPKLERAYVFFGSATSVGMIEFSVATTQKTVVFNYTYFNHGRTPAIIKAVQVDARYIRTGFPEPFGDDGGKLPTDFVFGADRESKPNEGRVLIKVTDYQDAKKGIGNIFFWGRIDYEDVFGKPHTSALCSEWHFGQNRFVISGGKELNYNT